MDSSTGVYRKYNVTKTDGTPVDPKAFYFVLRIDTDRNARHALRLYARLVGGKFGEELTDILGKYPDTESMEEIEAVSDG